MDIEKAKKLPLSLQQLSQSELCKTLSAGNFKGTSDLLPSTVKNAVGQPPICEVEKVIGRGPIVRFVEFELIRVTQLVSVGGNMNNAQIEFVATQLVEMFPNESLADFKLAFQRGCMGQYGEIFRMDGIVLRGWMEKFLDEKYDQVERVVKKEQESTDGKIEARQTATTEKNWLKIWADKINEVPSNIVPSMEAKDIKEQGKEDPPRRKTITDGYKYFEVRGVQIYAVTQEHAEELADKMLKLGMLVEDKTHGTND